MLADNGKSETGEKEVEPAKRSRNSSRENDDNADYFHQLRRRKSPRFASVEKDLEGTEVLLASIGVSGLFVPFIQCWRWTGKSSGIE